MTSKVFSCAIRGLDCHIIEVEADLSQGLPCFSIVGLGDASVQESRERIRSSIKNSGADFPNNKKIVNLAPARLRKEGSHFDLAIAASILIASKQISATRLNEGVIVGELALNGEVKPVFGILALAQHAKESGFKKIFVPSENAKEASFIEDIEVYPLSHLKELIALARGSKLLPNVRSSLPTSIRSESPFPDVLGLAKAKRALTIAAIGSHSVLLSGAPGTGKTLLARAFKGLLAPMTKEEIFETTKIYSISGLTQKEKPFITKRPFREVHHTASAISIIGGGVIPKPGEITLAHNGILFLDEITEFPKRIIETLRQPLEDKYINLNRARHSNRYPANFILVATMNPCPCGFHGDSKKRCICRPHEIQNYQKRLSGPIKDRIDIFLNIPSLPFRTLDSKSGDPNLIKSLKKARDFQGRRKLDQNVISNNADLGIHELKRSCPLSADAKSLLSLSSQRLALSNRSYLKVLKIARSIADLDSSILIKSKHVAESLQYRQNA